MASPFRVFRKYMKPILAVFVVVLMLSWVIGDSLRSLLGGTRAPGTAQAAGEVAVTWNGGRLTNAELSQLVLQRRVLNAFLRQVELEGIGAAQTAGTEPQPLRVPRMLGVERPQDGVEQDVLRTRLFADAARRAGMTVDDQYVVDYLHQLGRGYVTPDTIRAIISSMQLGNRGASVDYILDALREEMLARNYLASYTYALFTELPEDRWRDWLRLNDRVVVEAAAVPAESLLMDVKEPTEAELTAFFNEYKDKLDTPVPVMGVELPSPEPGFAIPRKVATQFLMADFNQFLAKVEDEVTDAEIEKFYEDNKDPHFLKSESLLGEPGDALESAPSAGAGKGSDASTESGAAASGGSSTEGGSGTNDDSSAGSDANTSGGAATQPAASEGEAQPVSPESKNQSGHPTESPFRLVAFADEAPAGGDSAGTSTAEAMSGAAAAGEEVPTAAAGVAPTAEPTMKEEKPKEFQPLEEVRDQIRRTIAETKVSQQLEELMNSLTRDLNEAYTTEYFGQLIDAETSGKEPPPPPAVLADLAPLAQKNGLEYQKTEPATWLDLRNTPIGKSSKPEWGGVPYCQAIFSSDIELYQPIATYDLDNNRYLSMKTQDLSGRVPARDEVRDQVVRAWKLREAGKLALKRAEQLAKDAQGRGGSLADVFADDKSLVVTKTDPFAYMTIGAVSQETRQVEAFRLSEPEGIVAAGPDFMDKVFALKDNEVVAAPNNDSSIVYVVRIAEHLNTLAEMQQAFLADDSNWYGVPVFTRGHYRAALGTMLGDFYKATDVKWIRDPDQVVPQSEKAGDEGGGEQS